MKKITLFFLSLLTATSLLAQTAEDALVLSRDLYEGTARTMAMGNAFTALGGDLGAISINPASSGVMGYSQFTFTPSLTIGNSRVNYLGTETSGGKTGLTLSNLGAVLSFNTGRYSGLVNFNFGFVYNKRNNFRSAANVSGSTSNSSMLSAIADGVSGYDWHSLDPAYTSDPYFDTYAPWPGILAWNAYALAPLADVDDKYYTVGDRYAAPTQNYDPATDELYIGGKLNQRFNRRTYGGTNDFTFNFGGNISDFLYFGANVNLLSVSQTTEEFYEEKADNPKQFEARNFISMDNSFWLRTTGTGVNFKFGVIAVPVGGLRIGATITTPTWYKLRNEWDYTMNTAFDVAYDGKKNYTVSSPAGIYTYRMKSPMRVSAGIAYTLPGIGLISADYEKAFYSQTRLSSINRDESEFKDDNALISKNFSNANIFRVGLEALVSPVISLRTGYQYHSAVFKEDTDPIKYSYNLCGDAATHVFSAGLGFNLNAWLSLDLAWAGAFSSERFTLYPDYYTSVDNATFKMAPTGTNKFSQNKVVCTLAFKF